VPTEQLSMRKTREILRLKWVHDRSHREIARALHVGIGTTSQVVARAKRAQIACWSEVEALSDEELEARMYPPPVAVGARPCGAALRFDDRTQGLVGNAVDHAAAHLAFAAGLSR